MPGLPKGHIVAAEQLDFPAGGAASAAPTPAQALPPLTVDDGPRFVRVSGRDFTVRFDRLTGDLDSWVVDGHELVGGGVEPNYWRAPTDNDFGNQMPRRLAVWRQASRYRDLGSIAVREAGPGRAVVIVAYEVANGQAAQSLEYAIGGDGTISLR
jgi:beta-galactosidase